MTSSRDTIVDAVAGALPPAAGSRAYLIAKRLLDMGGALVGLIVLQPVFIAVAGAIRLQDGGPVLYRREVVGRGGRRFLALKFRTMIVDADAYLQRHPELLRQYTANVKLETDPRVTPLGGLLRRTSIDELPQLWNVLRGEMSLVGPRMIHPSELERYGAFAAARLTVRPGITGLWQISPRRHESYEERLALDMQYIAQRSLKSDLALLARTVALVLTGRVSQV